MTASVLLVAIYLLVVVVTEGFLHTPTASRRLTSSLGQGERSQTFGRGSVLAAQSPSDDEEELDDSEVQDGPEQSQMNTFISNFLSREKAASQENDATSESSESNTDGSSYTHLIALPIDACHELSLELESVQRAILYHCPILVHSCVTQAMTRLPLLYVETDADSTARATVLLRDMVQDAVQKHIFVTDTDATRDDESATEVEIKRDDGTADLSSANADGIRPLMMPFESLEIDGPSNEVLFTAADCRDSNVVKLQQLVGDLRERIQRETGWKTALPPDDHASDGQFRPRIPFMRLPVKWNDILKASNMDNDDGEEQEQDITMLTSDQGGNGISPILWCEWWDDAFGTARMREVAVYKRRQGYNRLDEQAFYVPEQAIQLPVGNAALISVEAQHEKYSEERMAGAEALQAEERQARSSNMPQNVPDDDPLLVKTRDRLEALYQSSILVESENETVERESDIEEGDDDDEEENTLEFNRASDRPEDPNTLDDWTRQRIQEAVSSRARVQSQKDLATPREKTPITDNPVFNKYRDGTLVPASKKVVPAKELPPFPSREHCNGFWRIVTSPTGFEVEEGDSSRSDNLVLRVDGTVAGGPILDQETRQKASGGTWRMTGDTADSAELRIRLVIPPSKERILVLEGKLKRVSMSSDLPMATSTFGIPQLEEKAAQAAAEMEDLVFCGGSVHIEDAVTGKNREEVGKFSISKLHTPTDPSNYVITVPKPVRNQD
jgi:hypothetical protein